MLERFFNVDDTVEGTRYYIARSMMSASLIISTMQKLDKELTATSILEVFNSEEMMNDILDELKTKFPESEENQTILKYGLDLEKGCDGCDSYFSVIHPLVPRLEFKNAA